MSDQTVATLVISGLILLLPSVVGVVVGVVVGRRGNGRFLWVAAATALVLALFSWLSLAGGREVGGLSGLGAVLRGYLLSLGGLLAFQLLPIGPIALVVYSVWVALAGRRRS